MISWINCQQDGPKYDVGQGNYDLARSKLTTIGRVNGVLGPNEEYTKKFRIEVYNSDYEHLTEEYGEILVR